MALLVPAVQSAREAARRTQCRSNLHQIGIAIHSYLDVYGAYPVRYWGGPHARLLPYLDEQTLYEQAGGDPSHLKFPWVNETVEVYVCPSDPSPDGKFTNYAACMGVYSDDPKLMGWWGDGRRPFALVGAYFARPRDIRDGLSNTVAMGEVLYQPGRYAPTVARRAVWDVAPAADLATYTRDCRIAAAARVPGLKRLDHGEWYSGATYDHGLPPNFGHCSDDVHYPEIGRTAASEHVEGVHVLFCDGHVEFESNSVDLPAWRAIATVAGDADAEANSPLNLP
jgi:prepilin-type processing-associated H-X9-DG protein